MDNPVGKILAKAGLVSVEEYERLQEYQRRTGKSAGISVLELGLVSEHILLDCLSQAYGAPKINLRVIQIEPSVLRLVPAEICRKYLVIPVKRVGSTLTLAMANPTDISAIDNVKFATQLELSVVVATELMIREALEKHYGGEMFQAVLEEVFTGEEEFAGFHETGPTVQKPVANICPSCRNIVQANHRFCASCGAALIPPKPIARPIVTPPPPQSVKVPPTAMKPPAQPAAISAPLAAMPPVAPALPPVAAAESSPEFSPTVTVEAYVPPVKPTAPEETIPEQKPASSPPPPSHSQHLDASPPLEATGVSLGATKVPDSHMTTETDSPPTPRPVKEPTIQASEWKTVSVFVSTTLHDMNAERDYLAHNLFPKLRKELLDHRIHLMDFDPRQGVHPISLKQCLKEISSSTAFIGVLGERYGRILEYLPEDLIREHPWLLKHFGSSQTALEMTQALRKRERIRAFFYFRKLDFLSDVPETSRSIFLAEDPWAAAKLSRLKQQIRDSAKVREYSCRWSDPAGISGLEEFGKDVTEALFAVAQQERPQETRTEPTESSNTDEVDCTVFAPPCVACGETFLIQVFLHFQELAEKVEQLAVQFDETTQRRGFKSLESKIARGTKLTFQLNLLGLNTEDPIQSMIWNGRPESVQFGVTVPENFQPRNVIGKVVVSQNSIPIGHIKFTVKITAAAEKKAELEPVGEEALRYKMAFVSYASKDRDKVLARVQMLQTLGIRYFQDVLHLEPGDRWDKKLYTYIDHCDLFLLFWSNAAKESEWVRKEVNHALSRKADDDSAPPEIRPVIIEGPPVVPPWPELEHMHLNDRLLYFLDS